MVNARAVYKRYCFWQAKGGLRDMEYTTGRYLWLHNVGGMGAGNCMDV